MKINASGDGIDSNGDLYLEGGTVVAEGPAEGGKMVLWITMVREPFQEEPYWLWEVRECSRRFLRVHPSPC